jgi:transposase
MPLNLFGEKAPTPTQKSENQEIKDAIIEEISKPLPVIKKTKLLKTKRASKKLQAQDIIEEVTIDEIKQKLKEQKKQEKEQKKQVLEKSVEAIAKYTHPTIISNDDRINLMENTYIKYIRCPKCNTKVKRCKVRKNKNMLSQTLLCKNKRCDFKVNYEFSII